MLVNRGLGADTETSCEEHSSSLQRWIHPRDRGGPRPNNKGLTDGEETVSQRHNKGGRMRLESVIHEHDLLRLQPAISTRSEDPEIICEIYTC